MIQTIRAKRNKSVLKALSFFVAVTFITSSVLPSVALASQLPLPAPTQFVPLSENYSFPVLKGLKFDQSNPFRIEFIIDTSNQKKVSEEEASQLIRYFLAGLTIPGKDIWVNLSPYEKGRIVDESLGQTDLGKDLLSQDYILKQLSSSLTYPESEIGKSYWTQIYTKVASIANTTKLPINTFNKIWITPDKAEVYEDKNMALVTQAKLKTMLEEDYLALQNNTQKIQAQGSARNLKDGMMDQINKVSSGVMRDFILPKINEEVNSGKNFATLRQIHYSLILAIWFKQKFQDSIYKNYINQAKVKGIDLNDSKAKEEIYDRYVEAFQKGVYNYIKQDVEPNTNKKIKRQYVSGGYDEGIKVDVNGVEHAAWLATTNKLSVSSPAETFSGSAAEVTIDIEGINAAGKAVAISSPVQDDAAGRAKELDFLVRDGIYRIFGLRKHIENLQEDVLRLNRGPGGSKPGAEENSLIADSMKQIELNHKEIAKIEQDIKSWIAELQPLESALKAATEGKKDASSPVTAKELYDEATSGLSSKTVASNTAAHIVEKTASDIVQKFGASRKFTEKELKDYLEPIGNAPLSNFLMKAYTVLSEKAKTSSPVTVKDEKKIKTLEENIAWGERRIEELNVENTSLEDHIKEYRATSATLGSMAGDLIKEAKGQIENNNAAILRLKHNIFVYERELEILKGEEGKVSSPVGEESFRLQVARHKSSQGEISAASPVTADSSSELSLPEWLIVINVAVKERKLNLSDEIRQIEKNVWDALKDGVENKKLNLSSYLKDRDAFYSFLNQKGGIFEMAERGFSTLVVNRSLMSDGIYGWIQQALGQLTKQESDSADGLRFWFLSALRDDTKIRKIKVDAIKDYLSKAEELKNNLQDHNYWGQGFFDLFDNEGISWRASCFAYALAILSLSDDVTYRDGARWIINNKLGHDLKNFPERFYNYVAGILNDMAKEEALKYTDVFKKAVSSSPVENEVIDFLNSLDPQKIMVIRTAGARAVGDGRGIDYKEMKGRHTFFARPDVGSALILNEVLHVLRAKEFDREVLAKIEEKTREIEISSSPAMIKIPLSEESRKLQDTSHKLGQGQTNSDAGSESSPVKALDQKSYAELKQLQTKIGDELALLRFHGPNDDYGRPRRGYAEKIAKLTRSLSRVNDAFKKAREARQTQRTPDIDLDEVSSSPAGDNDQRQNELIGQITKLEEEKAGLNSRMARLSGQGDWRAAKAPNRRLHEIETKLLPGLYKQLFDLDDQEAGSQAGSSPVEMWKLSSSELLGVVGAAIRETGNAVEFYGKGEWSLRSSDKGKREKMIGSLKQIQDALSILFRKIQNEKVVIKAYSEPDFIRTLKGLKLFGGHDEDNLQYGALNLRLKETYEGMLKPGFKSLKGAKTANDKNLSVAKNIKKVQVAGSSGLVNAWEMKDAELVDLAYKAIEMIEKDMVRRQDDKKALYSEVDWLFGRRADLVNFINTIDEYHLPEFAKNEKGFKRFFGYLFKDGDIPELKHSAYFYLQMAQSGREKDSIVVSSLVKEVGSSSPVSEESRKLQGTSHTRANMINEMEKVKIAVKSVKVVSEKLISGENDIEGQTGELTKVFDLDNGKYSLKVIMHLVGENGHLRLKIYYLLLTEKQKTGDKINADITFNPDKDIQTYRNVYAHDDENEGVRYLLNTAIVKLLVDSAEQGDWDAAYSLIEAADKGDLIAQDAIKNLNPGHLEVSNPDRNESYILLQELEGRGNLLAKSRADRMQERDSKRQASSSPAGGIVDSASSFDDTQGRLTIDSAGKSHYGGIDMNGIKVAASVNSTPANMPIIDLKDFAGLTFRIVKLEEIKDIRLALNLAPADAPAAKGEEMRLAMAK